MKQEPHGPSIREPLIDNAESIAAIQVAGWQTAFRGIASDDYLDRLDPAAGAAGWRIGIAKPPSPRQRVFVAELESEIVGFVTIFPSRDEDLDSEQVGEVGAIYVSPEHWGRGVGQALMARAVDELRSLGFTDAMLWTLAAAKRSRTFYEAGGWSTDGSTKEMNLGRPVILVRYRLCLPHD